MEMLPTGEHRVQILCVELPVLRVNEAHPDAPGVKHVFSRQAEIVHRRPGPAGDIVAKIAHVDIGGVGGGGKGGKDGAVQEGGIQLGFGGAGEFLAGIAGDHQAIFAGAFAAKQIGIRDANQLIKALCFQAVRQAEGHGHAGGSGAGIHGDGSQLPANPLHGGLGGLCVTAEHQEEFLPAPAADRIFLADAGEQGVTHLGKKDVTNAVAIEVVDLLEIVDVGHDHAVLGSVEHLHLLGKAVSVPQAGEGVVLRVEGQGFLSIQGFRHEFGGVDAQQQGAHQQVHLEELPCDLRVFKGR